MSTPYAKQYTPPAPTVTFRFGPPGEASTSAWHSGLIDTGADVTFLPRAILVQAGVPPVAQAYLRGPWDSGRRVNLYLVDLELAELKLPGVYVADDEAGEEIVIGRNVLNKLTLLLDGPQQQVALLDDSTVRRLRALY